MERQLTRGAPGPSAGRVETSATFARAGPSRGVELLEAIQVIAVSKVSEDAAGDERVAQVRREQERPAPAIDGTISIYIGPFQARRARWCGCRRGCPWWRAMASAPVSSRSSAGSSASRSRGWRWSCRRRRRAHCPPPAAGGVRSEPVAMAAPVLGGEWDSARGLDLGPGAAGLAVATPSSDQQRSTANPSAHAPLCPVPHHDGHRLNRSMGFGSAAAQSAHSPVPPAPGWV